MLYSLLAGYSVCHFAHARPTMPSISLVNPRCICAAWGYCSRCVCQSVGRSVGLSVCLSARFLSNRGCCRYQTWICGYMQRALGTTRVWSGIVKEQHVYGGGLKLYTASYYARCALIRDRRLTAWTAWDDYRLCISS